MPDENNDELNEMLEKYHAPAEAGEAMVLRDIALHVWGEFYRGEEDSSRGDWYRPVYISKKEARHYRKQHAPAGLILPDQRAMVDFDPRKVAEIFAKRILAMPPSGQLSPAHEEYGRGARALNQTSMLYARKVRERPDCCGRSVERSGPTLVRCLWTA